jgi:hypothetical protein
MTTSANGSNATQTEEQFRTVLLPTYIRVPEEDIREILEFVQTYQVWYIHSVLDSLIVNSTPAELDKDERECLLAFMHTLGILKRDTDEEDEL